MPRFKIQIISETDPAAAVKALDNVGIAHIGPDFAKFVGSEGGWTIGEEMTAVVEADDVGAACRIIRRAVGPDPELFWEDETGSPVRF